MPDQRPSHDLPPTSDPSVSVPSLRTYILHGFIYATPHTLDFEGQPSFWVRHGFKLGLALALALHLPFWGYQIYRTFIVPFDVDVVESEYDVDWVTLTDPRYKPLPNPEGLVAPDAPIKDAVADAARRRAEEEARRRKREEEARRRAEAERRRREQAREAEEQVQRHRRDDSTRDEPNAAVNRPLGFGKVDVGPIKAVVTKLYALSESGELNLEQETFVITLAFRVEPSGRLSNIRIMRSSGIDAVDEAALTIARAVSASQALGPLHILTSTTLTLDVGPQFMTLRIGGFAASPLEATALQKLINSGLALVPRKPETTAFLNNTSIKADGKRLTATVQMTRSQLNALLKQNFKRG
ncbi:MAG: energy transducer TonB [Chloracidobacterium sp.]|nr:energy transducer TonB [Chloracidobacterium sp.]MDW8217387.1 energy transducer TonB [Acidobacteriota bacterium]